MSTETTNKKIKIDNGTTFGKTYTDKAVDERLQGLVSTATFTPVKEKANNSLQKPAGLTKTKLVGVGTNGQENIEIGDNLTLANGKLSATGGGEEILNVSVSMTAEQLSQSINNSGIGTSYTEENKIIVFNFIKAQKGIMRLTVSTPIGNLYMTLRPSLWKDDNNHSYNFEGSLYIESDLSAIGAKYFNQIIVRAICWDSNQSVDFRPTIIPIGDN